jgi:hypothetical protein
MGDEEKVGGVVPVALEAQLGMNLSWVFLHLLQIASVPVVPVRPPGFRAPLPTSKCTFLCTLLAEGESRVLISITVWMSNYSQCYTSQFAFVKKVVVRLKLSSLVALLLGASATSTCFVPVTSIYSHNVFRKDHSEQQGWRAHT